MSISSLFAPNSFVLYCKSINSDSVVFDSVNIEKLQIINPDNSAPTDTLVTIDSDGDVNESALLLSNVVDTTSTQTITGKTIDSASNILLVNGTNINSLINQDIRTTSSPTFNSPIISKLQITNPSTSITSDNIVSINSAGNVNKSSILLSGLVDTSSAQTLTTKTLDSASNTLSVNGTNINSLINQDVRTTSSPTFNIPSITKLLITSPSASATSDNIVSINSSGNINKSSILLSGIVDTSSAQTLTTKTLDSASNTLSVNGTNINSLINQDIRTTSSPTFVAIQFQTKPLNYYDNGTFTANFTGAATFTSTIHYVRIGTYINLIFYNASAAFAGVGNVLTATGVPTALRPVGTTVSSMVPIIDNNTSPTIPGICIINVSGNINITPTLLFSSTFLGPGNVGWTSFSMSYNIS
jgi:hypothetical protein